MSRRVWFQGRTMVDFPTSLANFIFKGFNFFGRSTRAEYWWILPILWVAIFGFFVFDVMTVWGQLQERIKPSLNPLRYDSALLFLITLIPRSALTVRRLNDVGRSPKWALLPLKSTVLTVFLVIGLASASLVSAVSDTAEQIATAVETGTLETTPIVVPDQLKQAGFKFAMMTMFSTKDGWDVAYNVAAATEGLNWFEALAGLPRPDLSAGFANIESLSETDPGMAAAMTFLLGFVSFGPVIFMSVFLFMMLSPTKLSAADRKYFDDSYSPPGTKTGGKDKSSAFASYAILAQIEDQKRDPNAMAAHRARGQAEAKALYRSRVLGQGPAE